MLGCCVRINAEACGFTHRWVLLYLRPEPDRKQISGWVSVHNILRVC
jgi:hypothetical protein